MRRAGNRLVTVLAATALAAAAAGPALACDLSPAAVDANRAQAVRAYIPAWQNAGPITGRAEQCSNGRIRDYLCKNVELLSFTPQSQLGGGSSAGPVWPWTDPETKKQYVVFCRDNGVSFVNVDDPLKPVYLGNLPANAQASIWCDVRVYRNLAYVGKDVSTGNGIQIFDLTRLRGVTAPQTFKHDVVWSQGFSKVHTIWIDEKTATMYLSGGELCGKRVAVVSLASPLAPKQVGCAGTTTYSHEIALDNDYRGPDSRYHGRQIAYNFTGFGKRFEIIDITDKASPKVLGGATYPEANFPHQGFPTGDGKYLHMNDELVSNAGGSRTYIWDIQKLDAPRLVGIDRTSRGEFTPHNGYTVGDRHIQASYNGGLRILSTAGAAGARAEELGYLDVAPRTNASGFESVIFAAPYLKNNVIAVSSMGVGLFLVRATGAAAVTPGSAGPAAIHPVPAT
ncbi:hypothetical protein GCM10010123_32870 [Pilimelia anulata]|uniref:Uncharacterized protein n=1 Tax=Pilimelia anulata TaxID=53371 RepID=A0A8J3BFM5_9ACTN|nr:choice-of-anchor B family protein [Pilimelia anulata]GGK00372.1 hypothetical protein GCM10010123_32870 [Pilimelia anulata]